MEQKYKGMHLLFPNNPLRKCTRCGKEAKTEWDLGGFCKSKTGKFGHSNLCLSCHAKRQLEIKSGTYVPKKRELDPNAPLRKCRVCGLAARTIEGLEFFVKDYSKRRETHRGRPHGRKHLCKTCEMKEKKERQDLIKHTVIYTYGNRCACCGETMTQFLEMDHINNDGREHRKKVKGTIAMWRDMIKQFRQDPDVAKTKFQVLCSNCNLGKSRNGGICPHKTLELNKEGLT